MSFGVAVYSAFGNVRLDATKKTVRLIKTYQTPAGSTGSITVPGFTTSKGFIGITQSNTVGSRVSTSWNESTKTFSWDAANSAWVIVTFIHTE